MSEDVARAVGAGSVDVIIIKGKDYKSAPLTIRELAEIERDCLKQYRRHYLETFKENADLLPNFEALMEKKVEIAARWDVDDLPRREVYSTSKMPDSKAVRDWLEQNMGIEPAVLARGSVVVRQLVSSALDSGAMSKAEYKALVGSEPRTVKVGYVNWWVTGAFEGMVAMVYYGIKNRDGLSKQDIRDEMADKQHELMRHAANIESMSAPDTGNT